MSSSFEIMRLVRGFLNSLKAERVLARLLVQNRPLFQVPSETHPGISYSVGIDEDGRWICTPCNDFRNRQEACKHIVEVLFRYFPETIVAPTPEQIAAVTGSKNDWYAAARRFKHVPYCYEEGPAESTRRDHAAEEEPSRVKELLAEIAWVIDKRHPHHGVGRPPVTAGSKVFTSVLREYRSISMRRFKPENKESKVNGLAKDAPGKTKIVEINSESETTAYLLEVFELVTAPYRLLEVQTISDATAFSPLYVANWLDSDHGRDNYRPATIWFKEHVTIGRISKAILAFRITPAFGLDTGDTSNFAPMLFDLRRRDFAFVDTAIADNTYLTAANISLTRALQVRLVGPLKPKNYAKNGLPSAAIKAIAEFRRSDPRAYDEHNRARQAVEGVFWCQKRPSGHLASIGSEEERAAYAALLQRSAEASSKEEREALYSEAMYASLFRSRRNECIARVIVQVLKRTVAMEKLYNRHISYATGSVFSKHREYSPIDRSDDAAA